MRPMDGWRLWLEGVGITSLADEFRQEHSLPAVRAVDRARTLLSGIER